MGDLITMYLGGFITGAIVGSGAVGTAAAIWWFRPQPEESEVCESSCATDEPLPVPMPEWDSADV